MAVSIDEARHAARLARLALESEELDALAKDLSAVLEHFESIAQFAVAECGSTDPLRAELASGDADGRDSASHRPDTVGAMLTVDEALRNAPRSEDGRFAVPGFLPDEP